MWWRQTNKNTRLSAVLEKHNVSLHDLLRELLLIADRAADVARGFYSVAHQLEVTRKGDSTPLTDADTALHKLLSAQLKQLSLTIPVLSEESTTQDIENRLSWPVCWVIDPLDGTKEFIERTDQFTINIALVIGGFSELGLISIPCRHEHWLGVVDNGAAVFPEACGLVGEAITTQARDCSRPLTMLASHRHSPKRVTALIESLTSEFGDVRRVNSGSAVKFCDVAGGLADVYPRTSACSEWDVAAGDALIRAAGGRVTDMYGSQIRYNCSADLLAKPFVASADPDVDYAAALSQALNSGLA